MRVIVVRLNGGCVVKVCESWASYDEWVEQSEYDKYNLTTSDCHVREEQ